MDTILVFAGGDPLPKRIREDLPNADLVVAADGGYDHAVGLGLNVDVLVGDLDSTSVGLLPDQLRVERHPRSKDATDLDLAIDLALSHQPERLVVVGGAGARLDHELATVALLCSDRWSEIEEIDWVSGRGRAHVVRRRRLLHGDVGATISLIPVGGDATGIVTAGLVWDLRDEDLDAGSTRGVSNVMRGPVADIRLASGCLLAVFPG